VHKLRFKKGNVVAEVKVRAMLADSALQSEDFERAAEMAEKMVDLLGKVRALLGAVEPLQNATNGNAKVVPTQDASMNEAIELCWRTCFQLGRQAEFQDVKRKLSLLEHALQLCPPENAPDILAVWRRLESEYIEANKTDRRATRSKRVPSTATWDSLSGRSGSLFNGHLSDYAPSSEHLH